MKVFGIDVPSGRSGYPLCPFCRTKEYANVKHLRQHMLWKHSARIPGSQMNA